MVHWNEKEAYEMSGRLRNCDIDVAGEVWSGGALRKALKEPVDAVLISLERRPAQGAEVGKFLRQSKSTRNIPLIFIVGPNPDRAWKAKQAMPDAIFTPWRDVLSAIKQAKPLDAPIVPGWSIASDKPLLGKLGIKENMRIGKHGAPDEFEELLGDLPEGGRFVERGKADLWFWFVRSAEELINEIDFMSLRSPIWICWAKGVGELKQPLIRETAKAVGMVDYRICSISKTWSGMLFRVKEKRTR